MKVLVIGKGGREHALAWALSQSMKTSAVYSCVEAAAEGKVIFVKDDLAKHENVAKFCFKHGVDLVVVGPEQPLAEGLADALHVENIKVFGPGKTGARLENSKEFSKNFMVKHDIPTASYNVFTDIKKAKEAAAAHTLPVVIKADGLAAGKGVRICVTREEALEAVVDFMEKAIFGSAGKSIVMEEFLRGPELSVMAFVDGENYLLMPTSRDHKRLLDGNAGPNTGGMGAYCPVAEITAAQMADIRKNVFDKVTAGLKSDGIDYQGVIYAGLMMTDNGPKVLEFNCRFGDPETQAVLPMLKTDLFDLCMATAERKLKDMKIETYPGAAVCVVLASKGYPENPEKGREIKGLENVDGLVFHAGTRKDGDHFYTSGGRVLGVTGIGASLDEAVKSAYKQAALIKFDGMQFRKDIGRK